MNSTEFKEDSTILYSGISNIVNDYMATSLEDTFEKMDDNGNLQLFTELVFDMTDLRKYIHLGNIISADYL
jgi:hypothetical protein